MAGGGTNLFIWFSVRLRKDANNAIILQKLSHFWLGCILYVILMKSKCHICGFSSSIFSVG